MTRATTVMVLLVFAACARSQPRSEPAPEVATAPTPDAAAAPVVTSTRSAEPERAFERRTAMEWERKWAADPPLATGDRASAEQPVTHAFQQLPEAKLTEAVECRRKLCRVVVQAKGESELEQVIHTVFGFNTPPLLKHASIVAERETGADGSVTATLFLWSDRSAGAVSP